MSDRNMTLGEFANSFPSQMLGAVERLAERLEVEAGDAIEAELDSLTPVLTGELARSRERRTSKSGLRLGWSAVSAIPIDIGRRKSKPFRRKLRNGQLSKSMTRMLGSDAAPEGMTRPAVRVLRSKWDEIVASVGEELEKA